MTTNISYGRSEEAWQGYEKLIREHISRGAAKSVCDIGGGANPLFSPEFVNQQGLEYAIMDISVAELDKGPAAYDKIIADVSAANFAIGRKFDVVFSKMLLEHVTDAEQFHRNVFSILNQGGVAIHFFPTLYTLPYLVNWLSPEFLAKTLYNVLAARDQYQHAKFTAYYRWCRGPTAKQIGRYRALGYEVVEYRGFFGHVGYYRKLPPLRRVHEIKTAYLLHHPQPNFTSYAMVVLKKV